MDLDLQSRCKTGDPTEKPLIAYWLYDGISHMLHAMDAVIRANKWNSIREGDLQCSLTKNQRCLNRWTGGIDIMEEIKSQTTQGLLGEVVIGKNAEQSTVTLEVLQKMPDSNSFEPHELNGYTNYNMSSSGPITIDSFMDLENTKDKLLKGTKFKVVTIIEPPFVDYIDRGNASKGYQGFLIDFMNELQLVLGFEYQIYEVADGKYGAEQLDGNWNGMIGDILNHTADVALAAMTITPARESVVDFTKRYMDYRVFFLKCRILG